MVASKERGARICARRGFDPTWLLVPGLIVLLVAFFLPVTLILPRSFLESPGGLAHYERFLTSPALVKILLRTVRTAFLVTGISLAVGYPFAYLAATSSARIRTILLGIVSSALFISLIVRSYAWLAILDRGGLINALLHALGWKDTEVIAVHNLTGVLIGLLQYALPFMILPLYTVMRRVDHALPRAAASLGADPVRAFLLVYLPLTLPGVIAGCVIVFISILGYFIVPSILGGPQDMMIGEFVAVKIRTTVEWGLGTAVASMLLVVAVVFFLLFRKGGGGLYEVGRA